MQRCIWMIWTIQQNVVVHAMAAAIAEEDSIAYKPRCKGLQITNVRETIDN